MPVTSNGPAIAAICEKAGVSKAQLARGVGKTKTHIGDVIKGKRNASPELRKDIANFLHVSVLAIETYAPDEAAS